MKTKRVYLPVFIMAAMLMITLKATAGQVSVEAHYLNSSGYTYDHVFVDVTQNDNTTTHEVPFTVGTTGDWYTVDAPDEFTNYLSEVETYSFADVYYWSGANWEYYETHEQSSFTLSSEDYHHVILYYAGGTFDIFNVHSAQDREIGQVLHLEWTADTGVEQSAMVYLELTRDDGQSWEEIGDVPYNNGGFVLHGEYDWVVTGPASQSSRVMLTLYDYAGNEDIETTNMFAITDPGCNTENWSHVYAGFVRTAAGVQPMNDGGYLMAGKSAQDCDLHLWKVNECGELVWSNECVNGSSPNLTDQPQTSDAEQRSGRHQNPILEKTTGDGFVALSRENGVKLIKLGSTGNVSWSTPINVDHAYSVVQTSDLGYLVAAVDDASGSDDIKLIKFNSSGTELWRETIGGTADEGFLWMDAKETSDGGYAVLSDVVEGTDKDWYLVKLDANRVQQWDMRESYDGNASPCAVVEADNGNLVVGWTLYQESLGDVKLTKVKSDGSGIWWERTYGGSGREVVYSLRKTTSGGYIIGGITNSFGLPDNDFYVIKTDQSGLEHWSDTYNGMDSDLLYSGALVGTDGYIMSGTSNSGYPVNAFVVKSVIPCCVGIRGNVDGDPGESIDISDLVTLVDYMFTGGSAPECWSEANVDGLGPDDASGIDIADLVYLQEYMFTGGPPPPDCP